MKKVVMVAAFVFCFAGLAASGESYIGYDENGNQVHVVDGMIVSTTPRANVQSPPPVVVERPARSGRAVGRDSRIQGGVGHGPTGRLEYNPYDPRKWWRDTPGMIDQINRDYPPVYPRSR